jgi:hypothetical protein
MEMKRIFKIICEAMWWYRDRWRVTGRLEHMRWAWRMALMSDARYRQAMAEGWRFERLLGGRCNVYPPEVDVVIWQAPNLAEAIAALKLEHEPDSL